MPQFSNWNLLLNHLSLMKVDIDNTDRLILIEVFIDF